MEKAGLSVLRTVRLPNKVEGIINVSQARASFLHQRGKHNIAGLEPHLKIRSVIKLQVQVAGLEQVINSNPPHHDVHESKRKLHE